MITTQIPQFLVDLEDRFNAAMVSNAIERFAECITDDLLLVSPEGGPV